MKKREFVFDLIKLFAMFCVLYGHCIQYFQYNKIGMQYNIIYQLIYSFHMPLFMMVSGYFSTYKLPFCHFVRKKFNSLIIPCISWGILFYLILVPLVRLALNESYCFLHYLGCFWFIKCLFMCFCCLFILTKIKLVVLKILAFVLMVCLTNLRELYQFPYLFPAFVCGYILSQNKLLLSNKLFIFINCTIYLLFIILVWNEKFWDYKPIVLTRLLFDNNLSLHTIVLDSVYEITRIIIGITGSISVIGIFLLILTPHKNTKNIQRISSFGRVTMTIYIIQSVLLEDWMARYLHFECSEYVLYYLIYPVLCLLNILLTQAIVSLMEKNKYLIKLFLGRNE